MKYVFFSFLRWVLYHFESSLVFTQYKWSLIRYHTCLFLVLLSFIELAKAQKDTTFTLPHVEIHAIQLRKASIGEQQEVWDSTELSINAAVDVADVLSRESAVFVKSYGGGGLATTSVRGGSAGHTAIVWNGFPLQSPMLGQLDLSLLPIAFVDEMSLNYGGKSAAWGSGAIGGLLSLDNRPSYQRGLTADLQTSFGSFGRVNQQLKLSYGNRRFSASTRIFQQQALNDFSYRIRPDLPAKKHVNAALRQYGLLQELYWKPTLSQELSVRFWAQDVIREIPPTSTQSRSEASQSDIFMRSTLEWKYIGKKSFIHTRAALFREKLDYRDELIGLKALSEFWTAMSEVDGQWYLNERQQFQIGIDHNFTKAEADGYGKSPTQNRISLFGSFHQTVRDWNIHLSGRQQWTDDQSRAFVPALAIEGELFSHFKLKAKISRNYRLPTLNDRYWQPGGNPDLLAEYGWSQELGLEKMWESEKHQLSYSITGFNRNIRNWILWSIQDGQAYWSANNIARVWSRGVEQRIRGNWRLGVVELKLKAEYDYLLSTNEVAIQQPKIAAGQQLIYTPRHRAFGLLSVHWQAWEAVYQYAYTSGVRGINEALSGYQLGHIRLQYVLKNSGFRALLFLHIDNIWNTAYRVIERRPMPGRSYLLGLSIHYFHH